MSSHSTTAAPVYSDGVVRAFALVAVIYGIVGMLVGVIIAAQLAWPELNMGIPYLTYGRLRPLHTNAVIFAFGGCVLFATSYHVVQRTCQTKLFLPSLAWFTFLGWNLVIVLAVITLPLGLTSGKEYAELEWPIDLLIAVVWVSYAIVFFGTVGTRKIRHIYVANWFFGAFIIAVALLHIVNSAFKPASVRGCPAGRRRQGRRPHRRPCRSDRPEARRWRLSHRDQARRDAREDLGHHRRPLVRPARAHAGRGAADLC